MASRHEEDRDIPSQASLVGEGAFDAQLLFPSLSTGIGAVVKRDGREAAFEPGKIASSILKAAASMGEADAALANSLASGVAIYLGKTLSGVTPTVAAVRAAVDRVLLEMGHTKTAAAYARHHRKRERVRKLQQGDIRALVRSEGLERGESYDGTSGEGRELSVRTSDERLVEWDRERIVTALVRETGMEEALAQTISGEVEEQVHAAQVRALTASLIRELVDAKLIEHGLERYRKRHMRLGVPLYDAEQIVCAPNQGEHEGQQHPGTTDTVLAERVKKEYALTQVFSQEVADAHLTGDLHLCGLSLVDRLHSGSFSLEQVKVRGAGLATGRRAAHFPEDAETLLAQAAMSHDQARQHFAESVVWDAFNVQFAPFVMDCDPEAVARLARLFLLGFHQSGGTCMQRGAGSAVRLCADVPGAIRAVEAQAPQSRGREACYGDCAPAARRFAEAVLSASVAEEGRIGRGLRLHVELSEAFWNAPENEGFLSLLVRAATAGAGSVVEFERRDRRAKDGVRPGQCRDASVQWVVLNLPRAAYRARQDTPLAPEQGFLAELERLTQLAVRAHREKREFIERLMMLKDIGPLGFLAAEYESAPLVDLDKARYCVAFTGLNECVQVLGGAQLHESEEARGMGLRTVAALKRMCRVLAETHDMRIEPAQHAGESVGSRFAMHDLQAFEGMAQSVLKTDPVTQDIGYTTGARLDARAGMSPMERVCLEGVFHETVPEGALSVAAIQESEASAESVGDFIKNAFYRTKCRRLAFGR